MSLKRISRNWMMIVTAVAGAGGFVGCGLLPIGQSSNPITERPNKLILFADPQSDLTLRNIRDVDDVPEEFVSVGTNGRLEFSDCTVCNDCRVEGASITIDDNQMLIRYAPGRTVTEERYLYLVSDDCFYIGLTDSGSGVEFLKSEEPFDATACQEVPEEAGEDDNPCNDLNTSTASPSLLPTCGAGIMGPVFVAMLFLGLCGGIRPKRRRLS